MNGSLGTALPAGTGLGRVRLRVRDLGRSQEFYGGLLGLAARDEGRALAVGTAANALLVLKEDAHIRPRPPGTAGLYHVALLLPDRASLGAALARLIAGNYPLEGFADHHVSEAVYLADPDGNGLELYADRPREAWRRTDGSIFMTTQPLAVDGLLADRGRADPRAAPAGTQVGHIHLHVTDLAAAESFYHETLGFDVVNRDYPGARFLSAGGYHHHVGLNTWGMPGPEPAGIAGLIDFEVKVPDQEARRRLAGRLADAVAANRPAPPDQRGDPGAAGTLRVLDPDGTPVVITA